MSPSIRGMMAVFLRLRAAHCSWFLVLALLLAPVIAAPILPLVDAPSHQARLAVLQNILVNGSGSPFYKIDTLLLPNMAFDFVGLLLTMWVDPAMAGRLFLAATLMLTMTGVAVLNRLATNRWHPVPLAAALFLYNLFLLLGFFSFAMGVALMIWALAARLALMKRPMLIQLAAGSILGIVLLTCHVSAFGIYAIMLAGIGIDFLVPPAFGLSVAARHIRRSLPRAVLMALELVPACVLFMLMSTSGEGRAHYDLPYLQNKMFNALKTVTSGSMVGDLAFISGATALMLVLGLCGRTRISRPFIPGLVMLCIAYMAIPAHLSGGSYVDSRLPMVIALLALASCRFEWRPSTVRWTWTARGLIAVFCVGLVVKQSALTVLWYREGQDLTRIAEVLNTLPLGAVILQMECQPGATDIPAVYRSRQPPLTHAAALAASDGTRFAAISWTIRGQQPIETVSAYQPYRRFQNDLSLETCSPAQVQAAAEAARRIRAESIDAGGAGHPVFVLLLRPRSPRLLASPSVFITATPELELYGL